MELSSIGDQVFAVESITKKRVRKVRRVTLGLTSVTPSPLRVVRLNRVALKFSTLCPPGTSCAGEAPQPGRGLEEPTQFWQNMKKKKKKLLRTFI